MPMMPSRLPQMRWPSIQVGDHPVHLRSLVSTLAPSASRRGTIRISAMVMSAVSSVRTFGVLVTVMPRSTPPVTSILSTPLPKFAISLSRSPALPMTASSMRSVTVGTSTSAPFTASISSACDIGWSSALSRVSNSSRMRTSMRVRQLARHHHDRPFRSRHRVAPECCSPASPRDIPRPVQVSLTGVLQHCTPHFRGRSGCDLGLSATDGHGVTSSGAGQCRCVTSRWLAGFVRLVLWQP